MCLITFMPDDRTISYEHASRAAINNPDGFGFAIHASSHIITDRDMDFEKLWQRFTDARKTYTGPALFHFRITTHGATNTENCHPFQVGDDSLSFIAHNGILPLAMPVNETRSDTRLFAELVLPACGGVGRLDDDKFFKELEAWSRGSKMVLFTANLDAKFAWYIVNEKDGYWVDGCWYSNTSYKSYAYFSPKYSHMYGDKYGWNDDWDMGYIGSRYLGESDKPTPQDQLELGYDDDEPVEFIGDMTLTDWLVDEMYGDIYTVAQIKQFTTYDDGDEAWGAALVSCHNCNDVVIVDPTEISHTHCGRCRACLVCQTVDMCNCWDGYEYHQSYTPSGDNYYV